jgi:hypothetical protein
VVEEAVGKTSALELTPPEPGTLNVPLVKVVRNADVVDAYSAVSPRTEATYVVFAAIVTGLARSTVRQPAVLEVGDPVAVASLVPVEDQSVTVYVPVQFAGR